jgi:hypothetical protein
MMVKNIKQIGVVKILKRKEGVKYEKERRGKKRRKKKGGGKI